MGEEIDARADQYALAATTYHLLTGAQLFPHSNPAVVISRHLNSAPRRWQHPCRVGRPRRCATRALAKNPAERYTRCTDFARALADHGSNPNVSSSALPTRPAPTPPRPIRAKTAPAPSDNHAARPQPGPLTPQRKWVAPAAGAIAVLLIGVTITVWRPWRDMGSTASPSPSVASPTASSSVPSPPTSSPTTSVDTGRASRRNAHELRLSWNRRHTSDIEHSSRVRSASSDTLRHGHVQSRLRCVGTASGTYFRQINIEVAEPLGFPSPATDTTGTRSSRTTPEDTTELLVSVRLPTAPRTSVGIQPQVPRLFGKASHLLCRASRPGSTASTRSDSRATIASPMRWRHHHQPGLALERPRLRAPNATRRRSPTAVSGTAAAFGQPGVGVSNPAWRNTNGAEGDRLCGAPNPYR